MSNLSIIRFYVTKTGRGGSETGPRTAVAKRRRYRTLRMPTGSGAIRFVGNDSVTKNRRILVGD